jgi:hypothetical protein
MTKKELMDKIRREEIKMKPKWWFRGTRVGKYGAWGLIILAIGILLAGGGWWYRVMNVGEIRDWGGVIEDGTGAWSLMAGLAGLGILGWAGEKMFEEIGENYKKEPGERWRVMAVLIIGAGLILTGLGYLWELEILVRLL